jgi:hypothetical protein
LLGCGVAPVTVERAAKLGKLLRGEVRLRVAAGKVPMVFSNQWWA